MKRLQRVHIGAIAVTLGCLLSAPVSALATGPHAATRVHRPRLEVVGPPSANASTSGNWFGYGQSATQHGLTLFRSITGNWTIPRVSQHRKGQAEYSSDWIGIGGGCVTAGCAVGDNTLIQTGSEQDVSAKGKPAYSAWWELIPSPSTPIGKLKVGPGNRMHAAITEVAAGMWKITITDLTRKQSFSKTVAYTSSQDTAEWIEETPLILGTGAGFAPLPNLTSPAFDNATTNGRAAGLAASEEIDLTDSKGKVIGTPSAPDRNRDGFNACAWALVCRAPTTS